MGLGLDLVIGSGKRKVAARERLPTPRVRSCLVGSPFATRLRGTPLHQGSRLAIGDVPAIYQAVYR